MLNYIFTSIFIAEFALKMIALSPVGYMRDKMNVFDGVIVLFSIIDLSISSGIDLKAFRSLRILRTLRVLRVTKLLRSLEFMKVIISVLQNCL
jgi:hypothetical protein